MKKKHPSSMPLSKKGETRFAEACIFKPERLESEANAVLGDDLKHLFRDLFRDGEKEIPDAVVTIFAVRFNLQEFSVFTALDSGLELWFFHIFCLIGAQKNGKSGILLNDGKRNAFFIGNGASHRVDVVWDKENKHWKIDLSGDVSTWRTEEQIFVRGEFRQV